MMNIGTKRKTLRRGGIPAASGRFVLRIDPTLHAALRRDAAALGLSLNEFCARKLAQPAGVAAEDEGLQAVVGRCRELFEHAVVGVLVHGSWARGEEQDGSDVDVLIVVKESVSIDRDLYRRWDAGGPLTIDGHPVEVHFARLISGKEAVTPLWAEIATDGIVIFEQGRAVSRLLSGIRSRIASGRLVRRIVHGQPYWTEVA